MNKLRIVSMIAITTFFGGSLGVLPAAFANNETSDDIDRIVEQIDESETPYADLELLDNIEQEHFLEALKEMSPERREDVMDSSEWNASTSVTARSGYSDIVMSTVEKAACVIHVDLISCNRAASDAAEASASARKNFASSTLHNGKGDAFRHCYWNARMTISIGENGAMKIASNHEAISNGPAREKSMDLANNSTGRSIGKSKKTYSKSLTECRNRANNGKLVTLK